MRNGICVLFEGARRYVVQVQGDALRLRVVLQKYMACLFRRIRIQH
jgi:hypothetical protein